MSLDIAVNNPQTGERLDMNWLRNPYGLCQWAEDNYNYETESEPSEEQRLWYVCNHWAYDEANKVDRMLFKQVVDRYHRVLRDLTEGYFFFTQRGIDQFELTTHLVEPKPDVWVGRGESKKYGFNQCRFGNPAFHLSDRYRPHAHTLEHYLEWFRQIVQFAEILQDPDTTFYCSN